MPCSPPPPPPETRDTVADDAPKRPWSRPGIRRMGVDFTDTGPTATDPGQEEDPNYRPTVS